MHDYIYSSPEQFGLTVLGEIEWRDESYEFDLTVVWKNAAGQLYYADDSGCSCPMPFEDFAGIADLTHVVKFQDLLDHLQERRKQVETDSWVASDWKTTLDRNIAALTNAAFKVMSA